MATEEHPRGREAVRKQADARDREEPDRNSHDSKLDATLSAPGARRTSNVAMLVTEAEIAADGVELGNPAQPVPGDTADQFFEQIDGTDLEPAWLRPWEGADD